MKKPVQYADIQWNDKGHPRSTQFDDIYFSDHSDSKPSNNGLEESRYVFLKHNDLQSRFARLQNHDNFTIGETGFGTGLNFLATWQLWQQYANQSSNLHFISVEKYPLHHSQLTAALAAWPELKVLADRLSKDYPGQFSQDFFHLNLDNHVTLTLIIDDACSGFQQCLQSSHPNFRLPFGGGVNAWFLDGFAPAKNPDMWSSDLFQTLANLSAEHTTLATFTAVGTVQRLLKSSGFNCTKVPGFGTKREMVRAVYCPSKENSLENDKSPAPTEGLENSNESSRSSPYPIPWSVYTPPNLTAVDKHVAIIGAGLAGCFTAYEFAKQGWKVTLFDRNADLAQESSGNLQGIVYAKLSVDDDALAELNRQALFDAQDTYRHWWNTGFQNNSANQTTSSIGKKCGVLQLAFNAKEYSRWQQCRDYFNDGDKNLSQGENAFQFLTPEQASELAGFTIDHHGIFFPNLGWVAPQELCRQLIQSEYIELKSNTDIEELDFDEKSRQWHLIGKENKVLQNTPAVVIANAQNATQFRQTQQLPLSSIRGQITYLPEQQTLSNISQAICAERYIAPAFTTPSGTYQSIGATYNLRDENKEVRTEDHHDNIARLGEQAPALDADLKNINNQNLSGRVGFRCTTPDYLPIVGPIHKHQAFLNDYPFLRKNANASHHQPGQHYSNLFINVGYGSRGLAYSPLCAKYLAALANNHALPISQRLYQALHPGRFTIRGLARGKY